jgi:hypothetical protein
MTGECFGSLVSQARKPQAEIERSNDQKEHAKKSNEAELAHIRRFAKEHLRPGQSEQPRKRRYCNVDV